VKETAGASEVSHPLALMDFRLVHSLHCYFSRQVDSPTGQIALYHSKPSKLPRSSKVDKAIKYPE